MQIRLASTEDIPLIRKLAHEIWPFSYSSILSAEQIVYMLEKTYSHDALQTQMANDHTFMLVLRDNTAVGFASYSEITSLVYKLHKLYLLPSEQGKGTGRWLMAQILTQIEGKGATELQLNVNRNNRAKAFYEKAGFSIIRSEDVDIGKGFFMNDYVMKKKLIKGS